MFGLRSFLSFLLLLTLLATTACTPLRRGGDGGGSSDDDDSAADDDDDSVGDDDDATDPPTGDLYTGDASGYLKSLDGGGQCSGTVSITVNDGGYVTDGVINCGNDCAIYFSGPYAWSEESFVPSFSCAIAGVTPDLYEIEAWIWGSENDYASGSITGYGETDYFYVSFDAYFGE